MKYLILCLFFCVPSVVNAFQIPKNEEDSLKTSQWKLPSAMTVERVEGLLNRFSRATYGKAFGYLGVTEDFFHGHLLVEKKGERLYARAVLYHTQESAHKAHWTEAVDKKFDYLNVATRNWIQWLDEDPNKDGTGIENAREYANADLIDPAQFFEEFATPRQDRFYTIHSYRLDPKKLGFYVYGDLQFDFYEGMCERDPSIEYDTSRGPLYVAIGNTTVCLRLLTTVQMITGLAPGPAANPH